MIWAYTVLNILRSPITGIGWYNKDWADLNIHGVNPHNIILNLLLQGGGILLFIVVVSIILLIKGTKKINNSEKRLPLYILLCYLLMSQFEVYNYFMLSLALLLIFFMNQVFYNERKLRIYDNHTTL